jgi:hypothetical protein
MEKTTVYLPKELKQRITAAARREGRSEAAVIRAALDQYARPNKRPRSGLFSSGDPTFAERVDELLSEGFGRD